MADLSSSVDLTEPMDTNPSKWNYTNPQDVSIGFNPPEQPETTTVYIVTSIDGGEYEHEIPTDAWDTLKQQWKSLYYCIRCGFLGDSSHTSYFDHHKYCVCCHNRMEPVCSIMRKQLAEQGLINE